MRYFTWILAALLAAGCAAPEGNKGLKRATFAEPYAEAGPAIGRLPARGKAEVASRPDILRRLSGSPQDVEEMNRVVGEEGKITSAAFWTGNTIFEDINTYVLGGVDWAEGAVVTPNAPTLKTKDGFEALTAAFLEVVVGFEWDLPTMTQENSVVVNLADVLGPSPDELMLCFGMIKAPPALAPPTDPYMIVIGIKPTSNNISDFDHLKLCVSGESVSFSAKASEIIALVDLCGGGHLFSVICDEPAMPFVISYVKVIKL